LTALSILASLQRARGDLDRIASWGRVFGMVNSAPGFNKQPSVINGFSDPILELYGPEVGAHARSAVGMAELPFDIPVEVEAELEIQNTKSIR
jgi:enamine deaminase RidA (YjgF/YER057c/UK114 family)